MTTERDPRVAALIEAMRPVELARADDEYRPHVWTDAEVRGLFDGNPEVDRLTAEQPTDPEVQKYLRYAAEDTSTTSRFPSRARPSRR